MTINNSLRPTTSPPAALPSERRQPAAAPAVAPVQLDPEIEADRRRSLREELDAAEERRPLSAAVAPEADVQDVVDALERLGGDAMRVLQPIDGKLRRLLDPRHIDEQA